MSKKSKTTEPSPRNAAQSKLKSNAAGSKKKSKKSRSTPGSALPRLPDTCWHQIVSFSLTDIVKQFDVVDDLQGANTLRNFTLVNQEWNAAMNNDLLWSLVWNDWKRQRNLFHGDAPQLDDLGIVIGENSCIKKGFAAAFSKIFSTCCIRCRGKVDDEGDAVMEDAVESEFVSSSQLINNVLASSSSSSSSSCSSSPPSALSLASSLSLLCTKCKEEEEERFF